MGNVKTTIGKPYLTLNVIAAMVTMALLCAVISFAFDGHSTLRAISVVFYICMALIFSITFYYYVEMWWVGVLEYEGGYTLHRIILALIILGAPIIIAPFHMPYWAILYHEGPTFTVLSFGVESLFAMSHWANGGMKLWYSLALVVYGIITFAVIGIVMIFGFVISCMNLFDWLNPVTSIVVHDDDGY